MKFTLELDETATRKVGGYFIYRSQELSGERPAVDGVYVQRGTLGDDPPKSLEMSLRTR